MNVLGLPNMQGAYDASAAAVPKIQLSAANGPIRIRDAATPIGIVFQLETNAGTSFFDVDEDRINVGETGNRAIEINRDPTGRGGIRYMPDGRTVTTAPTQTYVLQWDSLVVADIPGGAPFGNDTAPAMVGSIGECRFDDPGNLFSSSLLFNQATIATLNGVNIGPIYTMVNQPTIRTGSLGGSRTCSQHNALRIQTKWGPNLAGSLTQTSAEYILFTAFVDATVGSCSVTTLNYLAAKNVTLTAGGTIGTLNVLDVENITGPGSVRGINSVLNSPGELIRHTGTAPARFGGPVELGSGTTFDVRLARGAANRLDLTFTVGPNTLRIARAAANRYLINGDVAAEVNLDVAKFSLGAQTGAVGNQVGVFVAGTRATSVAGEWSDFLLTQAGNLTANAALSLVAGWTINAPSITLGSGTVTTAGALNVGGNVNQGSVNRFGVRILSNPSGGSGVNAALWVTAGVSRFDGFVDVNKPIALGGGAGATLGTIGATGPTVAAQSTWIEIRVGGVAHWIPAWV